MKKLEMIFLTMNPFCNYSCMFCNQRKHETKGALRLSEFKDFDNYVQSAEVVDITGYGEITMHPDFDEIIERITKYGKKIQMSTNGSLLTEDRIRLLEKSNLFILNISINSLDSEMYKRLTGGGNLEKTLKNIDNLCKSKIKDIYFLQCSFVINKLNFSEMKNFIDFGIKYNIHIKFTDLTTCIKDYDPALIIEDNEENRKIYNECIEYGKKLGNKFHPFIFDNRTVNNTGQENNTDRIKDIIKGCEYIDKRIIICEDGEVHACCWQPRIILGDVKKNTLEEIMNSEIYNDLRENIKQGSFKYCKDCRRLG